jgi:leucyl aminopeptidase (aminopeptidase T)
MSKSKTLKAEEGARAALVNIKDATIGERVIIFCDEEQREIGEVFARAALGLALWTRLVVLRTTEEVRKEVDDQTKEMLTVQRPDLCVNIFRQRAEETSFRGRFVRFETSKGARVGHCPGITMDMLTEGALSLTDEEYQSMFGFGEKLKEDLKGTEKVRVVSSLGADFTFSTRSATFSVEKMNLPCGEVMCSPVGDSFEGRLVCIAGGTNRMYRDTPVEIASMNGLAGEIRCKDKEVLKRIKQELDRDEGARYLGEFAFGINPRARLVDEFVEAEKVLGTIHMAFGGSYRPSKTHIDLLVENPTVIITKGDGATVTVMENGKFKT